MRILMSFLIVGLLSQSALACSLAEKLITGTLPSGLSSVGPRPVIVPPYGTPTLRDDDGNSVALEALSEGALVDAYGSWRQPIIAMVPSEDLADGDYTIEVDGQWVGAFTVSASAGYDMPNLETVELGFVLERPLGGTSDEEGGCGAQMSTSCDGVRETELLVTVNDNSVDPAWSYLVTLVTESEEVHFFLRTNGNLDASFAFSYAPEIADLTAEEVCVTVAPVGDDGSLGETVDAGCIDARDEDDARVRRFSETEEQGCRAAGGGAGLLGLFAAFLQLVLRKRR